MPNVSVHYQSDSLADIERTLMRKIGGRAARQFMIHAAKEAAREAEELTVGHIAAQTGLPPTLVRSHVYFRSRPTHPTAIVAWSPDRQVPLKSLGLRQTKTGVTWQFAGKRRTKRHGFVLARTGHAYSRAKRGGRLVPRLPIERIRGPVLGWDAEWASRLGTIIETSFARSLEKWMRERVR